MIKKGIVTGVFIFMAFVNNAQSLEDLQVYMEAVRSGTSQPLPATVLNDAQNAETILQALKPYYADTVNNVRAKAYDIAHRVGQKSQQTAARQLAVAQLVNGVKDKDTGISGNASQALTDFEKEDFNQAHKNEITELLGQQIPHKDQLIKVAGYINLMEALTILKQLSKPGNSRKARWAAYLALARMGEQEELEYVVKTVSSLSVNDDVVYEMVPDLIYTRQKLAFDYLFTIIASNKASCTSADPDASAHILCGYRTMEYIAPYINNFPLPVVDGELMVDDYVQALQELRAWYVLHQGDYEIIKEGF